MLRLSFCAQQECRGRAQAHGGEIFAGMFFRFGGSRFHLQPLQHAADVRLYRREAPPRMHTLDDSCGSFYVQNGRSDWRTIKYTYTSP